MTEITKPTISGVMYAIAVLAIVFAILRNALTGPELVAGLVFVELTAMTLAYSWFIGVPRLSTRLLRHRPGWRRMVLEWVANTPPPFSGLDVLARRELACLERDAGRYEAAEHQLRRGLDAARRGLRGGLHASLRQQLADVLERQGRNDEAKAEREAATDLASTTAEMYQTLVAKAKALEDERRFGEAYDLYDRSLSFVPEDRPGAELQTMVHLAETARNAGWPGDSLGWAESILENFPRWTGRSLAFRLAAAACTNLGRTDEAEEHARRAVEDSRTDEQLAEAFRILAELRFRLGDLDDAERLIQEMRAVGPATRCAALLVTAGVERARGDFRQAIAGFREAITLTAGRARPEPAINRGGRD